MRQERPRILLRLSISIVAMAQDLLGGMDRQPGRLSMPQDCLILRRLAPDGKGKRPLSFIIDYERCCFCGLCVDPCPTKPITAIYMSHDYELAGEKREEFIVRKEDLMNGKPVKVYRR